MVWEKFFCQPPDLNIVSAQTGKVFDEHSGGFSLFKLLHHFNETGTVHGHAGNAIIQKVNQIGIAFFLCNFGEQFLFETRFVKVCFAKQCAIRIDKQQKERYNNVVIDNDIII